MWDSSISESHEDIISHFGLTELNVRQEVTLARIEIVPPDNDFAAPLGEWVYHTDQDILPPWFDAATAERAGRAELPKWLAAKIVLAGQSRMVKNGDYVVCVSGGTIKRVSGGTIERVSGGTIKYVDGGTIKRVDGLATVTYYRTPPLSILKGTHSVLIDRSAETVKVYIGEQSTEVKP